MRASFLCFIAIVFASFCYIDQNVLADNKLKIITPPGAPSIVSGFKSAIGVNFKPRNMLHQGIDILGDDGQPIIAVASGEVLEASVEKCWGPTVAIDHGKGLDGKKLIALYGHLGEMFVKAGDIIKRGQLIGNLGDNHFQFRCIAKVRHLHFQIGREFRPPNERSGHWGHSYYLKDGMNGINPHLYWADGKGIITCFKAGQSYSNGSITYPVPCNK